MADPNIYQGGGKGGTQVAFCNVVAAQGFDNTGVADFGSGAAAFLPQLVASGQSAWFPAGIYIDTTPFVTPAGARVQLGPNVTINQNLTTGNPFARSTFCNLGTLRGTAQGTIQTTPTYYVDNPTVVVNLATEPLVGNSLRFDALAAHLGGSQTYLITAVAGVASPWTVTLARPIVFAFVATDLVNEYSGVAQDITVEGLDALVSGVGGQTFEFADGNNVRISRLNYDSSLGAVTGAVGGLDVGMVSCIAEDCEADASAVPYGYYQQSNERSEFRHMRVKGGASVTASLVLFDCFSCGIVDCWTYGSGNGGTGFEIISLNYGVQFGGSQACYIQGGGAVGGYDGLSIAHAVGSQVSDWSAVGCSNTGVYVDASASKTVMTNVAAIQCNNAFTIGSETNLKNIDCSHSGAGVGGIAFQVNTAAGVVVTCDGLTNDSAAGESQSVVSNTGGILRLKNVRITSAVVGGQGIYNVSGRTEIDGAYVQMTAGGGSRALQCDAGTMTVTNCHTGTGVVYNVYIGATGTVNILGGCDFSTIYFNVTAGGVLTMLQQGGVAAIPGGVGTTTMTFAQHYAQSIEIGTTGPIAAGAQVVLPLASFIGQQFVVKNNNTASSTTTVFGVIIPVASTYLLRCNSAGVWEHDILT